MILRRYTLASCVQHGHRSPLIALARNQARASPRGVLSSGVTRPPYAVKQKLSTAGMLPSMARTTVDMSAANVTVTWLWRGTGDLMQHQGALRIADALDGTVIDLVGTREDIEALIGDITDLLSLGMR